MIKTQRSLLILDCEEDGRGSKCAHPSVSAPRRPRGGHNDTIYSTDVENRKVNDAGKFFRGPGL